MTLLSRLLFHSLPCHHWRVLRGEAVRGMMSQTDVAATARQATGDEAVPPQAEIAAKHPAMRAVEAFAEALIVLALLGELLLVLANVFARVYLQRSFLWSDEVARL